MSANISPSVFLLANRDVHISGFLIAAFRLGATRSDRGASRKKTPGIPTWEDGRVAGGDFPSSRESELRPPFRAAAAGGKPKLFYRDSVKFRGSVSGLLPPCIPGAYRVRLPGFMSVTVRNLAHGARARITATTALPFWEFRLLNKSTGHKR